MPGFGRGRHVPHGKSRGARRKDEVKFVIASRRDYEFAREFIAAARTARPRAAGAVFARVCRPEGHLARARRAAARRMDSGRPPAGAAGLAIAQIHLGSVDARSLTRDAESPIQTRNDGTGPKRWFCSAAAWIRASPRPSRARRTLALRARQLWPAHRAPRAAGVRCHRGFLGRARAAGGAARPLRANRRLGAHRCSASRCRRANRARR